MKWLVRVETENRLLKCKINEYAVFNVRKLVYVFNGMLVRMCA